MEKSFMNFPSGRHGIHSRSFNSTLASLQICVFETTPLLCLYKSSHAQESMALTEEGELCHNCSHSINYSLIFKKNRPNDFDYCMQSIGDCKNESVEYEGQP